MAVWHRRLFFVSFFLTVLLVLVHVNLFLLCPPNHFLQLKPSFFSFLFISLVSSPPREPPPLALFPSLSPSNVISWEDIPYQSEVIKWTLAPDPKTGDPPCQARPCLPPVVKLQRHLSQGSDVLNCTWMCCHRLSVYGHIYLIIYLYERRQLKGRNKK